MIASSLHVERHEVFAGLVRRVLGEQMTRHLLGDELVAVLRAVADHSQHHHVHSAVRLLVHYVRTPQLLYNEYVHVEPLSGVV